MKNYLMIGEILADGTIERESTFEGCIFKDERAFLNKTGVCYVGELDDTEYTYEDFIDMANNNEDIAKRIFYSLNWQSPGTKLEELIEQDEVHTCTNCNKMFLSYDVENCPYCNAKKSL